MKILQVLLIIALLVFAGLVFPAELNIFLFDEGGPLSSAKVVLDRDSVGKTDSTGQFHHAVAVGNHRILIIKHDKELAGFEFATDVDEVTDVTVTAFKNIEPIVSIDRYRDAALENELAAVPEPVSTKGLLRGKVISLISGEPLAMAKVTLDGGNEPVIADGKGEFEIELSRGDHSLFVTSPGYSPRTVDNIHVTANVINETIINLSQKLAFNLPPMEEVKVVGTYAMDIGSIEAVTTDLREAMGVSEVLGVDQMLRAGDSSVAEALKRVTGLTIQDDKFVVVRGQPERYTQTLWNGSYLPSPDPIRRIVPLDLFPTGSLEKIDVEKSYDASFPGSFGAGLIGLKTVGVPDINSISFSGSFGMNSRTTGKTGFDYDGGGRDILGYDDGTRELPAGLAEAETPEAVTVAARGFKNIWNVTERDMDPDYGLGLGWSRAFTGMGADLGLRLSLDWKQEHRYVERLERDFALRGDGTLAVQNDQTERRTDKKIDLSGMLVLTASWENHTISSNSLLLRKTTKRSAISEGFRVVSQDLFIRDFLLEWNERELFAQHFAGEHTFGKIELDWRAMLAKSSRYSPDRRNYIYRQQTNGEWVYYDPYRARRRYDENDDDVDSFDADLTIPLITGDSKLNFVSGYSHFNQTRDSQTRRYSFRTMNNPDLRADPEVLLDPANLGDTLSVSDQTQTNDKYLGDASVEGIYVKADYDLSSLRIILGVRKEDANFKVRTFQAGGSQGGQLVEAGFDESNTLPSLSVTWRFRDDMQLRFSSGRSLSRPMLNELSPSRYYDPETDEEYLGNPDLKPAIIDSIDTRWEWYPSDRELVAFGYFTKDYTDAIEESFVGVGGSSYLRQISNAEQATVSGTELSARFDLSRIMPESGSDWSELIYVQVNAAFIDSKVTLTGQGLETSTRRPLQGQADEVYNLQVGYDGDRHDLDVSFNLVGKRLQIAGIEGQPDVYQEPIQRLDLNYSYVLMDGLKLKFKAQNLLDEKIELTQGSEVYRSYKEGIDYQVGLSWTIE